MDSTYRVTSVGERPEEERSHRTRNYLIAMAVRMGCIIALLFVKGWFWMLVFALGAVFLPYFAVVLANVKSSVQEPAPDAVTPLELSSDPSAPENRFDPSATSAHPDSADQAPGAGGHRPASPESFEDSGEPVRPADVLFVVDARDVPTVSERVSGDRRFTADQHGGVSDPHTAAESSAAGETAPETHQETEPGGSPNPNNGGPASC